MKKNRSRVGIDVDFNYDGKKGTEFVFMPYDLLMETFLQYCKNIRCVNIEGTDTAIWNLFSSTGFFDSFIEEEDLFAEALKEKYYNSPYYQEDLESWIEDQKYE